MGHSICINKYYGKEHVYVNNDFLEDYFHSFTMYMQAIAPSGRILPYKIHGRLWFISIVEHGHYLGGYKEIIYLLGCIPKAPNISHLFKTCEKTMAASKWWENHLPYHYLMQSGELL